MHHADSGQHWGPGIQSQGGKTEINNGTIIATGGSESPGIGGSKDDCGTIIINDGKIKSISGGCSGASGIGGSRGYNLKKGSITINGGTIEARADNNVNEDGITLDYKDSDNFGTGIGAGALSGTVAKGGDCCIPITINGGTVEAYGCSGNAAIGAGEGGNLKGKIKITGGYVKAVTSNHSKNLKRVAAAIGAGAEDSIADLGGGVCDTKIEITGGTVIAQTDEERKGGVLPQAIGHGAGDKRNDGVTIYEDAIIEHGKNEKNLELISQADRMKAIDSCCVKITPPGQEDSADLAGTAISPDAKGGSSMLPRLIIPIVIVVVVLIGAGVALKKRKNK